MTNPTQPPTPDLAATLRRIQIRNLAYDARTGQKFAVGFDAAGNPYRAFDIDDHDHASTDKYELAQ